MGGVGGVASEMFLTFFASDVSLLLGLSLPTFVARIFVVQTFVALKFVGISMQWYISGFWTRYMQTKSYIYTVPTKIYILIEAKAPPPPPRH